MAQPFLGHAERALLVAEGWALLALVLRPQGLRPLLIAAGAWAIFGLLEAEATRQHADIRVDLLITWTCLLLCTAAIWTVTRGDQRGLIFLFVPPVQLVGAVLALAAGLTARGRDIA